jgi:hypothetical protein
MKEIHNNSGIFQTDKSDQDIYICGDIHGDYQCLIHCLVDLCKVCEITKIYDDTEYSYTSREYLKWIPKTNSVVIFSGDLIHRKRYEDHVLDDECSDIYIITNLLRLKKEANKYSGDIIIISGNHEIMNIVQPDEDVYTSEKNIQTNIKFFSNKNKVNEYIANSYAWIKLNDILIAHGGLCSDYLSYIDNSTNNKNMEADEIIAYVNNKYREYFHNYDNSTQKEDLDGYNLFIEYDFDNKKKHNMFWCREWGYAGINCDKYEKILKQINCRKMIIAHCPQFLSPDKPKMINFECKNNDNPTSKYDVYNLARIDLGMSRSFEYNQKNNFIYYLSNNYNRKMAVLKLLKSSDGKTLYFNNSSIITYQISCIQYLLLKFGFKYSDWKAKNITSDWIGFGYIDNILDKLIDTNKIIKLQTAGNVNSTNFSSQKVSDEKYSQTYKCVDMSNNINNKYINKNEEETILMCTLYPLIKIDPYKLNSIDQHNKL